jgi:glycosyltransferase involved in cell wall biosynthesis
MRLAARESTILVESPPLAVCEVCVVVPVRNERAVMASTLQALARQTDFDGRPVDPRRYEIIVLANNCRDDSAAVARSVGRAHPDVRLHIKVLAPESW